LDGRGLTAAERKKADRKLDKSSSKIYRQKHDSDKR